MKRLLIILLLPILIIPVSALDLSAPTAPSSVQSLMPDKTESFSAGFWFILREALESLEPELAEAGRTCVILICCAMLLGLFREMVGMNEQILKLLSAVLIGTLLFGAANSLIRLADNTISQISNYGKLLLPAMTTALAAQGGTSTSVVLSTGTSLFSAVLTAGISRILVPVVYIYLALSVARSALDLPVLRKLPDMVKRMCTWCLTSAISIFTGYMAITGAVAGSADAAAMKVTRAAISGMIPVVGGILSEASEAVLVGAVMVKNAAGVYGMLAIIAIFIGPFLKIGVQYLLLKVTGAVCGVFGGNEVTLVQDFSGALGLLLGMTGACTLLYMISMICFLKGVG